MADALPNPLHAIHAAKPETEFQPYADLEIVTTFGQPEAEYAAVRKACGLMDLPQRGVLELSGRDRLSFLNNLITNQTWDKQTKTGMAAGMGVYAYFLNLKGPAITSTRLAPRPSSRCILRARACVAESVEWPSRVERP